MRSVIDHGIFASHPMWMCPTCGRVVTLPMGTSTSIPEHTICQCAGRLGNDGRFYGHYTMMVPNEAGKRFDEQMERWRKDRRRADEERWEREAAAARVSAERWARVYQSLGEGPC